MTVNLPAVQEMRLVPAEHEMQVFHTMAESAVASKFYKNLGDKPAIMMLMLAARELNIPPMMALNGGIRNINGNIEISARLMNGMMRRSGISINIIESTDLSCTVKGARSNGDTAICSYTVKEAQQAGLVKVGGGWTRNPKDMCFARAISRLARQLAPDVIGGCYVEGEISDARSNRDAPIEEMVIMEPIPEIEEADWISKYLNYFDSSSREDALKYLDAVKGHYGISAADACKQLVLDVKKTLDKFSAWRKQACAHVEK